MSDLLSSGIVDRIIGVIDLLRGQAVHAVAGDREHYRPIECCSGDPLTLAGQYRHLGVSTLYVADLDSITGGEMQVEALDTICRSMPDGESLLDIGWSGEEGKADRDTITDLANIHPGISWIGATESMRSLNALVQLAELVTPDRVFLGLDYRDSQLIAADEDEAASVGRAAELGCRGAVVLDIASVGTSRGPTTINACQRVKQLAPTLSLCSGGGIRSAQDVRLLVQAGCDQCLVATALLPLCG